MTSWALVNRLRVRRDISSDDMLAIEDVRQRVLDRVMVDDDEGCCMLASATVEGVHGYLSARNRQQTDAKRKCNKRVYHVTAYVPNYPEPDRFSFPRGRSLSTILLLPFGPLGPGLRVRLPLVGQPHTDTGCLLDLDLPRPPPCGWSHLSSEHEKINLSQKDNLRVHCNTADAWSPSQPAIPTCFTERPAAPCRVANLADSSNTVLKDLAYFTALKAYVAVPTVLFVM